MNASTLFSSSVVAGALLSAPVVAAETTFTLSEQVGQSWERERVAYPFSAADRACAPDSLRLHGPDGPVPVQLSDVESWPGGTFVRTGRVHFVVDKLDALGAATYTLAYAPRAAGRPPATDLRLTKGTDQVELTTAAHGVRLLLGERRYDPPVAAAAAPGPLVAMRHADGEWTGGSTLYGDIAVASYASRLVDEGPVFAAVETVYTYADGSELVLRAAVFAGDNGSRWAMRFHGDRPADGVRFNFGAAAGATKTVKAAFPRGISHWSANERTEPLGAPGARVTGLVPQVFVANWFPEFAWSLSLVDDEGSGRLHLYSREPGAWVDPVPFSYAKGETRWSIEMIDGMWSAWKRKQMPVQRREDGTVTLDATLVNGGRKWGVGQGPPRLGERLDVEKDYVLDWPETNDAPRPRLFMDRATLLATLGGAPDDSVSMDYVRAIGRHLSAATHTPGSDAKGGIHEALPTTLAALGFYDTKRNGISVMTWYDALIDTEAYAPEQRKRLKAQMAYLAHSLWEPHQWSIERGYITGNPNMSLAYVATMGIAACLLPDHPMAATWHEYATAWMRKFMADEVGPNGVWICEGSHYNLVSFRALLAYAVAAKRAGYVDLFEDETLKRLGLFFAKTQTPVHDGQRRSLPFGRGTVMEPSCVFGILARETAASDPAYSRLMQWIWAQEGYPASMGNNEGRMGGLESLYFKDRSLPQSAPAFVSERFPELGVVFRHGYNTAAENCLMLLSDVGSRRNLDVWTPNIGSLAAWWARGRLVSSVFYGGNYGEHHELLRDGVMLARNYAPGEKGAPFGYYTTAKHEAFSALSAADYVRATYEITEPDTRGWLPPELPAWPQVAAATEATLSWTRQALYLRDPDPAGANYLVLRDRAAGGQPTVWQFRAASEKLGSAAAAKDVEAFLADKPGDKPAAARELAGDRFTAVGAHDVDLEFFVAAPAATKRHALRWGKPDNVHTVYRDILHLQRSDDGVYFVAAFPRLRAEAAPTFTRGGEGTVIRVAGAFGTDFAFLSHDAVEATEGDAAFAGTAASVQDRKSGLRLALSAPGSVAYRGHALAADVPVAMRVGQGALALDLPADHAGGVVRITAPGAWTVAAPAKGVAQADFVGGTALTIAAGVTRLDLKAH